MEPASLIERAQTMQDRVDESIAPRRLNLVLLGLFATLALALSAALENATYSYPAALEHGN